MGDRIKIAVLNECFLSGNNLAYLESLGDLEVYSDTVSEELAIDRMIGREVVLADMYEFPITSEVLKASAGVKLLCINSTGFDRVALESAAAMNIKVANTPGFSTEAVAEHTFALLLSANRHIIDSYLAVKGGTCQITSTNKDHYKYLGFNLFGTTIGIIGLGAIGSHAAAIAHGFGMHVLGYSRSGKNVANVEMVSLDVLFERSDVISLHTPLNEQSRGLINAATISKMKDGAIIINTARGGCVVSKDLAVALTAGKLASAGLDDLDTWSPENPLLCAPNTVITPHSGWFTNQALSKIGDIMTGNVQAYVEGRPRNIVSV